MLNQKKLKVNGTDETKLKMSDVGLDRISIQQKKSGPTRIRILFSGLYCTVYIDISWLDWAYKSPTCDVMYRRPRPHLYYGGQI
jgi:hypothetical protein